MERGSKKQVKPMLYIQQPHMMSPKAKMQSKFIYREKEEPDQLPEEKKNIDIVEIEELKDKIKKEEEQFHIEVPIKLEKELSQDVSIFQHNEKTELNEIEINEVVLMEVDESPYESEEPVVVNKLEIAQANLVEQDDGKPVVKDQVTKRRVPFSEKGLGEKIKDLRSTPVSIVKIQYEFITSNETHLGYFISQKDGIILIQEVKKGSYLSIPIEALIDIKLIGI